jgi:hypothetical protein
MTNNFINEVTLDCLMNKEQYNKYISKKNSKRETIKDVKFYRKRIYYLTKEMLLSKEQPMHILPEVKIAFDNYAKTCINYFKVIDRNDIIQEDYKEFYQEPIEINELNEDKVLNESELLNKKEDANNYLMRQIKVKKNSLDRFVKKTSNNPKEIILPKQKNINLKDPSLKNKGIIEKKNITNKYEEIPNKKITAHNECNENTNAKDENKKETVYKP